MPNTWKLAEEYVKRIRLALISPELQLESEIEEIINDINNLVYTNTGNKISLETKYKIIREMREQLVEPKKTKDGWLYKEADNKQYLELVSYIMKQIEEKGGK